MKRGRGGGGGGGGGGPALVPFPKMSDYEPRPNNTNRPVYR